MKAPLPDDEADRLATLRGYDILDSTPAQEFDDLTLLASQICGTPVAMISLVDEDRQWFKSKVGITESETPRDIAFCAHGILQEEVFIVEDTLKDARFETNPLVTGPTQVRFYAGSRLTAENGHALGMICVNDNVPRQLSLAQKSALQALSRQVVAQIEMRQNVVRLQNLVVQLKQTEEELRGKTAFLEAGVNSSPDGVIVVDGRGQTILRNQRAIDMLEIPDEVARDRNFERRIQWVVNRARNSGQLSERISYLNSHPEEMIQDEIELKDGKVLELYSSPVVGKDSQYFGRIWQFRDITQRKKLESRLYESQKLETVGKLAGGIAHDFNSILTTIIGHAELLRHGLPPDDSKYQSAAQIGASAVRAAQLTQQLLAFGQKQMLKSEVLNVNTIVETTEAVLQRLLGPAIEVTVRVGALHPWTVADHSQLQQMLVQFGANSRDAMPGGGRLSLETGNVTLGQDDASLRVDMAAGEYVTISVTDTGSGISEAVKQRLFEPFFTTKPQGQGSGLGLSMCYGMAKQIGGHISVESTLGQGTTFRVFLPRAKAVESSPQGQATPLETHSRHAGRSILVVEDHDALRDLASVVLKKLGYEVHEAANGPDAIALAERLPPVDLLLTDIVMPGINGKELADHLQLVRPNMKVLFTSGYTADAIVQQGVLSAGIAFLQKPYTPTTLIRRVGEAFDGVVRETASTEA